MRISGTELLELRKREELAIANVSAYQEFKRSNNHLIPTKDDPNGLQLAKKYLSKLFLDEEMTVFDAVVGERGFLLASDNDTHYRGRVLEACLGGNFNGKALKDFDWGELKLIETKSGCKTKLKQIMTCGVIFTKNRSTPSGYDIVDNYFDSHFFNKMKDSLIVSYYKEGKQLGSIVNNVCTLNLLNPQWSLRLQEDWESIKDEMILAIEGYNNNTVVKKPSGIAKSDSGDGPRSKSRRPNGLLGIRNDSVIITSKFFTEIVLLNN